MRRFAVMGVTLMAIFMSGCSGSNESEQQHDDKQEVSSGLPVSRSTEPNDQLVPGYSGGCEAGFTVWTQRQFTGVNGGYGALVRSALSATGQSAGLAGNDKLQATGWFKTGELLYPDNPARIRGEVWYYIPQLPNGGAGWVADAGVRAVKTKPAPNDRADSYKPKTQAAPQPPECKLTN